MNLPLHSQLKVGITFVRLLPNMKRIITSIWKEARSFGFFSMNRLNQCGISTTSCSYTMPKNETADSSFTWGPIHGVTMLAADPGDTTTIWLQARTPGTCILMETFGMSP